MYAACRLAADRCRRGEGPAFVAAETFRMGGHATHDIREGRRTFDAASHVDPVGANCANCFGDILGVQSTGENQRNTQQRK